jgi:hypothetical protein
MKVKDLLNEIQEAKTYYPDILEWDIALEQHPNWKDCPNCNKKEDYIRFAELYGPGEDTILIKSHSIGSVFCRPDKTLGILIHY